MGITHSHDIKLTPKKTPSNCSVVSGVCLQGGHQLLPSLVVGAVGEVVEVVLDGHEQAGQAPAAAQLGGEHHAGDEVVGGRVGRGDGPQQVSVSQAPYPGVAVLAN